MKSAQLNNGEVLSYSEHNLAMKNLKPTLLFIHGNFSSHIWW